MTVRLILTAALLTAVIATPAQSATPNHVQIAVRDMEASRHAFSVAGFRVIPARAVSAHFSHAAILFADGSYLELLKATVRTAKDAFVYDAARFRDGAVGAGFEVADIKGEREYLVRSGFAMKPIEANPHWSTLSFAEPAGIMEPFFYIKYRRNSVVSFLKRWSAFLQHPNGALGLTGLDVAVEPGLDAVSKYRKAGLAGAVALQDGAGDPRIVRIRIATSSASLRGRTIVVDGCRITFE